MDVSMNACKRCIASFIYKLKITLTLDINYDDELNLHICDNIT